MKKRSARQLVYGDDPERPPSTRQCRRIGAVANVPPHGDRMADPSGNLIARDGIAISDVLRRIRSDEHDAKLSYNA